MILRALALRFTIRGPDGVREHALVAHMRRRRGDGHNGGAWGDYPLWRLRSLELRRTTRAGIVQSRAIPTYKVGRGAKDALSVMAEREARWRAGLPTMGDAP